MLQQELAALKSFGELLPDRLLDDPRPRESDQRSRLCDVEVAEHRKACRYAAGGRVGQHGDIRDAGPVQSRQCSGDLGHLHQREHAFHHACAARARHDDERLPALQRHLCRPRDLLPFDDAHAAANERVLHDSDDHLDAVDAAGRHDDRVGDPGGFGHRPQTVAVRLGVREAKGVVRAETRVMLAPAALVEQHVQPFNCSDPEVMRALRTDAQIVLQILVVQDLSAPRALDPETLRHATGFVGRRRFHPLAGLLEPGHGADYFNSKCKMQNSNGKVRTVTMQRPDGVCILHLEFCITSWVRSTSCPGSSS